MILIKILQFHAKKSTTYYYTHNCSTKDTYQLGSQQIKFGNAKNY